MRKLFSPHCAGDISQQTLLQPAKALGQDASLQLSPQDPSRFEKGSFGSQAGPCLSSCSWHKLETFTAGFCVLANSEEM